MINPAHHHQPRRRRSLGAGVGAAALMALTFVTPVATGVSAAGAAAPAAERLAESSAESVPLPSPANSDQPLQFEPDSDSFRVAGSVPGGLTDYHRVTTHAPGLRLTTQLHAVGVAGQVSVMSMSTGRKVLGEASTRGMRDDTAVETSTFVLVEPGEYLVMVDGGHDFDYELVGSLPGRRLGSAEHPEFAEGAAAVCAWLPTVGVVPFGPATPTPVHTDRALHVEPGGDGFAEADTVPAGYANYRDFTTYAPGQELTVHFVSPAAQAGIQMFSASGQALNYEESNRRLVGTDIVDDYRWVLAEPGDYRMVIDGPAANDYHYEINGALPGYSASVEQHAAADDGVAAMAEPQRLSFDSATNVGELSGTLDGADGGLWVLALDAGQTVTVEQLGDLVTWHLSTASGDAVGCGAATGPGTVHIAESGDHLLQLLPVAHDAPTDYHLRLAA